YLPRPIPTVSVEVPSYVQALRDLPGKGGVLDALSDQSAMLFYQTIHEKPLAFGFLARVSRSVAQQDDRLRQLVKAEQWDRMWPEYRLRYVIAADPTRTLRNWPGARTMWDAGDVAVVDVSELQPKDGGRLSILERVAGVDDERAALDDRVV